MKGKTVERKQELMFPPNVDDWVSKDDPVRMILTIVENLDFFELGIHADSRYGSSYSSRTLLAIWIFAYFCNIRSTRAVERACRENVRFFWISGLNTPDHNTLWRFFHRYKQVFPKLFKIVTLLCCDLGLVNFALHAVDGTKISAQCSNRSGLHKKALEKLDKLIQEMISAIEMAELNETDEAELERLSHELINEKARAEAVAEKLALLKSQERKNLNTKEPEAEMMKTTEGKKFSYNAQAAVDTDSGVVVAGDVSTSPADNHLLNDVIDKIEETVGEIPDVTVADNGYFDAKELANLEQKNREAIVAMKKTSTTGINAYYADKKLTYNEESNVFTCPHGAELKPYAKKAGKPHKQQYRCERKGDCLCKPATNKGPRSATLCAYRHSTERMRQKVNSEYGKAALKTRKCTVELLFAQIKHNMGFRRFAFHGKDGANAQWTLMLTVVNLQKLFKHMAKNQRFGPPFHKMGSYMSLNQNIFCIFGLENQKSRLKLQIMHIFLCISVSL